MLQKLFAKIAGVQIPESNDLKHGPRTVALINMIHERSQEDPLVGAKMGAKEVYQRLLKGMKTEKGVHIESLLCALGALAGYACQANLRVQAQAKGLPDEGVFKIVETTDGKRYFFGDPLNKALTGTPYSVWGLAGGAAQQAGAQSLPDLHEIFQHTATVLGSEQFGIPRVPERHRAGDTPQHYLEAIWPVLLPTIKLFCPNSADWPILFSLAIQEAILASHKVFDPTLALTLVMECAIPMSKVDLAGI